MDKGECNSNRGDEDYETSLRRLMQTCLPPILAKIVDRRPADPIEYLAQALYKFREVEEAQNLETMSASGPQKTDTAISGNTAPRTRGQPNVSVRVMNKPNASMPGVRLVQDDLGDEGLGEVREDLSDITGNMVHMSEEMNLVKIGDIFDDYDIT